MKLKINQIEMDLYSLLIEKKNRSRFSEIWNEN